jgi:hypothetical protein
VNRCGDTDDAQSIPLTGAAEPSRYIGAADKDRTSSAQMKKRRPKAPFSAWQKV